MFTFTWQVSRPLSVLLATMIVFLLSGCGDNVKPKQNNELATKNNSLTVNPQALQEAVSQQPPVEFAPTVVDRRKGLWKGGAAPINKQQSGMLVYYKFKQSSTAENVQAMTLRFEGIVADDALVDFRLLDGARFVNGEQRTQWRLIPNETSQVSFDIIVPTDKPSYLALTTMQHNLSSSRAFLLTVPN